MKSAPAKKVIPSGAPASAIRSQETTIRKAGYPPISFLRIRFSSQVSSSFIETAKFYQFYLLTRQPGAPIPRKQFHSIRLAIKNTWTITASGISSHSSFLLAPCMALWTFATSRLWTPSAPIPLLFFILVTYRWHRCASLIN